MREPAHSMSEEPYKPLENEGTNSTDDEETQTESAENEEQGGEKESTKTPDLAVELEKERKKAYELQQRLKKAEAKAKKQRTDLDSPDVPTAEIAIQEQVLKAQGEPPELVAVLKAIAEEKGIDLLTAKKDDYYAYRKEKMEQEKRDKEAQLGASKGSGSVSKSKDFSTPALSPEEHKAMWRKAMGR